MLSNIPTYVSSEDTGSINDQVKINRTNAEMMLHKCTNASTEVKIGFNDTRGIEESATIVNSFTEKSVSFEDCHVDAAHALAGTSFSQFNEHYTTVCFKEFQPSGDVKLHSMQRNSHLKKDEIIRKGINRSHMKPLLPDYPGISVKEYIWTIYYSNQERGHIKHELIMGNEFTTEMTVDDFQLIELYRQFSKYGQNTRRILMKGDLDNLTTNFTVREAETSRHLMLGNIYKVHNIHASPIHTDSENDHERSRSICFDRDFFTEKSDSGQYSPVDKVPAIPGVSCFQLDERNNPVCFEGFQYNSNVKRQSTANNVVKQFICSV
ncbi:hypothetical protein AVEN_173812-1 [Araneus ventricosus]|uniref:Uncharacterized protein n=1 Tax=Araneus ventricosus TaxID=182803 RepID=A0A4Y2L7U0_ARAVE|nr:hypothetical protein AVEN_173812-1 [Araneus ventricosus]